MEFLKNIKRQSAASRLSDELLHEIVMKELANGEQRQGLMAMAIADAGGDPNKAEALYIKYRVRSMHDEREIASAIREAEAAESMKKNQVAPEVKSKKNQVIPKSQLVPKSNEQNHRSVDPELRKKVLARAEKQSQRQINSLGHKSLIKAHPIFSTIVGLCLLVLLAHVLGVDMS